MALPTNSDPDSGTFEELGLDPLLIHALSKLDIIVPKPVQRGVIPLVIEGKNVDVLAETGSGKTFAYLLPMLQNLKYWPRKSAPTVFILVPTQAFCHQVYSEVSTLIEGCRELYKAVKLLVEMSVAENKLALAGPPDILISTPAGVAECLRNEALIQGSSIQESIKMLILDEDVYD